MILPSELVSQFAKLTVGNETKSEESTVYGTIIAYNGEKYVKFDGSDLLTPVSFTTNAEDGERVTVSVKNHSAIVTGNISSPAARTEEVEQVEKDVGELGAKITEFDAIIADVITTEDLAAESARIDELVATNVVIRGQIDAQSGSIGELQADNIAVKKSITAAEASIQELNTNKISAKDIEGKYANIDFSNIGKAAMEYLYAQSGLIEDVTIGEGTITGNLVGVTISGDLIEGNTIVAEKLVIKGDDGLYYKLNTDGIGIEGEQTDYNSLNGSIIKAHSITATQISVTDLVAFDATIGGFNITDNSLYSGVKETVDNDTKGIYFDSTGQMAIGDASNFIKFYVDEDGTYKLTVSASTLTFGGSNTNVETAINDVNGAISNVESTASNNFVRIKDVMIDVDSINTMLSTLVTGQNGESLMTQTDSGWVFSMANIQDLLSRLSTDVSGLDAGMTNTNSRLNSLDQSVLDLGEYTDYIKFGVDNGKPCIILGEADSSFKVMITNTDIRFMEGTVVPASISNQALNIETAVVNDELRQGNFAWVSRSNGHYSLLWKE